MADIVRFPSERARAPMRLTTEQKRLGVLLFKKINRRMPETIEEKAKARELSLQFHFVLRDCMREA